MPSEGLEIRCYRSADHSAVVRLHHLALREVGAHAGRGPWDDDLDDIERVCLDGGEFLVGHVAARLVAMGALRRIDGEWAEIKRLRVEPDLQRRGYGSQLLDALETRAAELGFRRLRLDTTSRQSAAQRLFAERGYVEVSRSAFRADELILYEKDLRGGWLPPHIYEEAYLQADGPRAQSGFGGDEARWEAARQPIAEAIDRSGTFLDVGCANGYLLESLVRWSAHPIEPYGLDSAPGLVELARERLPHWPDRIFLGDALTWEPPRRFDFVRTELLYVPERRQADLVARLLADVLSPGSRLIVCGYGSPRSGLPTHPVRELVRSFGYEPVFALAAEAPEGGGPIVELAVIEAGT
jgi:GNAT superfamily N-acetyltransferase/SAM-dependent methyltransferase